MRIVDYFECENKEKWIEKVRACDWSAAKFLADLLENDKFSEVNTNKKRHRLLAVPRCL